MERRKHIKSQPEGTKDDVAMGGTSSGQSAKGANKSTDAKLHNAVLKTLCVLPQQLREVRGAVFMCCMIKQEAARVQETERAIARLFGTGGDQGQGIRRWSTRDSGLHVLVASAVGKRQHSVSSQRSWCGKSQANVVRFGTGGCIRSGTSLQAGQSVRPSSEASRTRHQRGTTPSTHSWGIRTNRSESSPRSSSKRSFGPGTVSSDRTELKKVNFVAASCPDSPIRPRARQVDWRHGIASDQELMDRATGKMVGTGGSAVSSMLGQLLYFRGVGPRVRC